MYNSRVNKEEHKGLDIFLGFAHNLLFITNYPITSFLLSILKQYRYMGEGLGQKC